MGDTPLLVKPLGTSSCSVSRVYQRKRGNGGQKGRVFRWLDGVCRGQGVRAVVFWNVREGKEWARGEEMVQGLLNFGAIVQLVMG